MRKTRLADQRDDVHCMSANSAVTLMKEAVDSAIKHGDIRLDAVGGHCLHRKIQACSTDPAAYSPCRLRRPSACPGNTCANGSTHGARPQMIDMSELLILSPPPGFPPLLTRPPSFWARRIPNPQWDTKLAGWLQRVQSRAIEEQSSHNRATSSAGAPDPQHILPVPSPPHGEKSLFLTTRDHLLRTGATPEPGKTERAPACACGAPASPAHWHAPLADSTAACSTPSCSTTTEAERGIGSVTCDAWHAQMRPQAAGPRKA